MKYSFESSCIFPRVENHPAADGAPRRTVKADDPPPWAASGTVQRPALARYLSGLRESDNNTKQEDFHGGNGLRRKTAQGVMIAVAVAGGCNVDGIRIDQR